MSPKGPPFIFFLFRKRMDVEKQPKGPFYIFRYNATYQKLQKKSKKFWKFFWVLLRIVLDTLKSFCYFWALDMAQIWAVPDLLKLSMPFTLSILTFCVCVAELIELMLIGKDSSERPFWIRSRVWMMRCDWSVRCGGTVRSINRVILPIVWLNSNKPYIWLITDSSNSISSRRFVSFSVSDSPV